MAVLALSSGRSSSAGEPWVSTVPGSALHPEPQKEKLW